MMFIYSTGFMQAVNQLGDANEVLNERAVVVMARMSNKLTGRDFSTSSFTASSIQHAVDHSSLISGDSREVDHGLSVKLQVQKLIIQATSHENLCQNYVGYDVNVPSCLLFTCLYTFCKKVAKTGQQAFKDYMLVNVAFVGIICMVSFNLLAEMTAERRWH